MANNNSKNRYFVKNRSNAQYTDITTMFDGVAVLKLDGMNSKGKPVNVFTQQWVNSQTEDFMITTEDYQGNPVVIRENVDLELTFIVSKKYADGNIDVLNKHDAFVNYMTGSDIWVRSSYVGNKFVHCVCLKDYKPTTTKLNRGDKSYMMGTITLHTLEAPV